MPRLPRASLRLKLLGAFVVVLLPVLILLVVGAQSNLERRQQGVLDAQTQTAQAIGSQVDESFTSAIVLGWAVANDPVVQSLNPSLIDPHLQRLVRETPALGTIAVFDATGQNRGWGDRVQPAKPRISVAQMPYYRPYFEKTLATNAPTVSEVLLLRRPSLPGVVFSVPIRDSDGNPIGVVAVMRRSSDLSARLNLGTLQAQQAVLLIGPTGRMAVDTALTNLPYSESDDFANFPPVQIALSGKAVQSSQFTDPLVGDERLGAFVPTPRYHWVVGVTVPRAVALATVQQALRDQLAVFGIIVLLSVGLAALLAHQLLAPILRLEHAAHTVGRGNLAYRVSIRTRDELEELGNAFNQMAADLQRRQSEAERFHAEAEQRARQLSAVISSMTDGVLIAGADGNLINANPAAFHLLGLSQHDLGHPLVSYPPSLHLRTLDGRPVRPNETPLGRAISGETFAHYELQLRGVNGSTRIIEASGAPVRNDQGKIVLGVAVVRDVTDVRRHEREAEAVGEIARALVHEIGLRRVVDVIMDQSLRVLGTDAVALWLADPARRELTLAAFRDLSPTFADEAGQISYDQESATAAAARTERIQIIEDVHAACAEGKLAMCALYEREGLRSLLAVPLRTRGRLVGVVTYATRSLYRFSARDVGFDTTIADLFAVAIENAHLYDEVRQALRLREEFMAAAAHELKTPVTVIKGWTQILLKAPSPTPSRICTALQAIERQSERITSVIDDLLAVVRLRPGIPAIHRTPFNLSDVVREAARRIARSSEIHHFTIDTDGPMIVDADQSLIEEVIGHLLENALRYSPQGGDIEVRMYRESGDAIVSVIDHGVGIAPERQQHLFEPFYEGIPPGAPGYVGIVSLGLYLSKQIVEAHGGRIWFSSTPDHGSTFSFSLPLWVKAPAPTPTDAHR